MSEQINKIVKDIILDIDVGNKLPPINPILALFGNENKKGLSAIDLSKEIIANKHKIGLPSGTLEDGSDNLDNKLIYLICEELIKHIQQRGKISVVVPSGTPVTCNGVSAAGVPVTVQGITTNITTGVAIIQ